jgi:hypothetical protein
MNRIYDMRMHDGSRHFASVSVTQSWYDLRDWVKELPGAKLTGFICDHVTEAWIDFTYRGHSFSINDQYGDYWFFVKDPVCPEEILDEVLSHFEKPIVIRRTWLQKLLRPDYEKEWP